MISRRQAVLALGGVLAQPLTAFSQPAERSRRVGVLMGWSAKDAEMQSRLSAFKNELQALGWSEARNIRYDVRWTEGDAARTTALARELVLLGPDVILSGATPATLALQRETSTIPIVFSFVTDPLGSGLVKSFARPGGNITGFVNIEPSLVEKWLELATQMVAGIARIAVMFNPDTAPHADSYFRHLSTAAQRIGITASRSEVRSDANIDTEIAKLAGQSNVGLILMHDTFMVVHRKAAIAAAARYKVPAIYFSSYAVLDGGLISYGVETIDLFRRTAPYVDRILRGARVEELPVQLPARFELFINLRTAKALGLAIPKSLVLRADRVIE